MFLSAATNHRTDSFFIIQAFLLHVFFKPQEQMISFKKNLGVFHGREEKEEKLKKNIVEL